MADKWNRKTADSYMDLEVRYVRTNPTNTILMGGIWEKSCDRKTGFKW